MHKINGYTAVESKSQSLWEELQRAEGKLYQSVARQEISEEEKVGNTQISKLFGLYIHKWQGIVIKQDTMQSVIESLKAQVRSLQHELCVVKDDSNVRIQEVQRKVEDLEKENAILRMQPPLWQINTLWGYHISKSLRDDAVDKNAYCRFALFSILPFNLMIMYIYTRVCYSSVLAVLVLYYTWIDSILPPLLFLFLPAFCCLAPSSAWRDMLVTGKTSLQAF